MHDYKKTTVLTRIKETKQTFVINSSIENNNFSAMHPIGQWLRKVAAFLTS